MISEYYSAREVIYLAAWGSTTPPCEREMRRRIAERWGADVLQSEAIEQTGGERRNWLVLALRRRVLRCEWRRRHGRITTTKWPHLPPQEAQKLAAKWTHTLRAADPAGRFRSRIIVRLSGRSASEILSDLRADLRPLYSLRGTWLTQLDEAIRRIVRDLAAERILVEGRDTKVGPNGSPAEHASVPASYFAPKGRTITIDNRACYEPDEPQEAKTAQLEWYDLRFLRVDADRLYRPVMIGHQGAPGSASTRIGAYRAAMEDSSKPPLADLPAYWTLPQCIAWIMYRDTALVDKTVRVGARRLDLMLSSAAQDRSYRCILNREDSEQAMLVRLRAGDVVARGRRAGQADPQDTDTLDWIDGKMGEEDDHMVLHPLRAPGRFWFDIVLPKAIITRLWQPLQDTSHNKDNAQHAVSVAEETPVRRASDAEIHDAIGAVYDFAQAQGMKPPNLNEIAKPVAARLRASNTHTTFDRIKKLAADPRYDNRRWKIGRRLYGSLAAFSHRQI